MLLSIKNIFKPDHERYEGVCIKMLPLVLFEIFYKVLWLILVAYPLWSTNQLIGSPAEEMTYAFL